MTVTNNVRHEGATGVAGPEIGDLQGLPPAHADAGHPVRRGLPGPHQRGLRRSCAGRGQGHHRRRLRPGRRHLLHRLRPVRDPQQPAADQVRRQGLAGPHRHHLGHRLRLLRVRPGRDVLHHPALPAGCHRGRAVPRRHHVPGGVVPQQGPRQDVRHLLPGPAVLPDDGRPALRLADQHRRPGPRRPGLAGHVLRRGHAGRRWPASPRTSS